MATINKNITIGLNAYNASSRISAANWENSLVEPVMVEEGDAIYVKSSFIDARLHTSANILIEQDTTIEIENMFYYINRGGTPVKSLYNKNIHPYDPYQAATLTSQVGVGEYGTVPDQSPNDADFAPITGYPPGYDPAWAPLPPDDPNAKPPVNWKSGLPLNITDEKNILNMAPIVETIVCPEFDGQDDYLNPCKGTGRLPVNCGDGMPYLLYRSFPSRDQAATANGVLTLNNPNMTNAVLTGLAPLTTITWNTNEAGPVTFLNLEYSNLAGGIAVAGLAVGDIVTPSNLGEQGQNPPCFLWNVLEPLQTTNSDLMRMGVSYQIIDNPTNTLLTTSTGKVYENQTVFVPSTPTILNTLPVQVHNLTPPADYVLSVTDGTNTFTVANGDFNGVVTWIYNPDTKEMAYDALPENSNWSLNAPNAYNTTVPVTLTVTCPSLFNTINSFTFISQNYQHNNVTIYNMVPTGPTNNLWAQRVQLSVFDPTKVFTVKSTVPPSLPATNATVDFTVPTGTRVYIPGTDFAGGSSPENDVYITYNGPPYSTVGPPASDWSFIGQPPFSSGTVTSNETMTNNVIEPFVKLFKYTIPRGSYSPDTLGVMITRAMSQQKPRVMRDMTLGGNSAISNTTSVGGLIPTAAIPNTLNLLYASLTASNISLVFSNKTTQFVVPFQQINAIFNITLNEVSGLVSYIGDISTFIAGVANAGYTNVSCTLTNPTGFPGWVVTLTGTYANGDFIFNAEGVIIKGFSTTNNVWWAGPAANNPLPEVKINCLTVPCQLPSSMLYGDQRSTWNSGCGASDTNNYTNMPGGPNPDGQINIPIDYPYEGELTFTPYIENFIFNPAMNKPLYDIVSQQCGWNSLADPNGTLVGQYPLSDLYNGLNVFEKPFYDGYSLSQTNLNDFGTADMIDFLTPTTGPQQWGGPPAPTSDACMYQDYTFASKNKFTQPIGKGQNPPGPNEKQNLSPDYNGDIFKDYDDTPFLIRPTAFQTVQQRIVTAVVNNVIVSNEFPPVQDDPIGNSLYILRPDPYSNNPDCPSFQAQDVYINGVKQGLAAVTNVPVYRLCVNYAHNEAANRMEDIQYNKPQVPSRRPATVEVMYKPFLTDIQSNYFQSQFLISDKKIINDYYIKPILSTQAIPLNTDLGDAGNEVNGPTDISSPVVGAQQISLIWNPVDNVFQFTYTHTPLYNKPDLSSAGLNEVVGVYPCNVFVNNNQNNLIPPAQQGTNTIYPAPYFRTVKGSFQATRQSGVIFKSMKAYNADGSPSDFWSKIGFNVADITASPPEDNPSAPFLSYNRFQEITTGGFFGTGSVLNPETKACGLQEIPYLTLQDSFNMAGWWTRDVQFTPFNLMGGSAKQYQQTFTLVSNPLYYEVQSTNYLTAANVPLDTKEAGHYLLEIQGYNTTHIDETQKSEIKSIVSSYYISQNSFVSNAFPENFKYYHYGPDMKIACLKIRILNPITKQEIPLLGNNSTVYLSIDKASPTIQKGMKPEEIEGLPFNWFA